MNKTKRPFQFSLRSIFVITVVLAVVMSIITSIKPLTEKYLSYRVSHAETAEEEDRAFALVNKWGEHGWAVIYFDQDGNEMRVNESNHHKVYSIEIQFPGGTTVRKKLCNPGNLAHFLFN